MGTNLYAHLKAKYQPYDTEDPVSALYLSLDDDPSVMTLENGYVWRNIYYPTIEELDKVYYHVLHIGKASAGWHFSLCIYPPLGISDLDDWKKLWESKDCEIYTEYGDRISEQDTLSYILNRKSIQDEAAALKANNDFVDTYGVGKKFATYEGYMAANGAERGLNGLWAHKSYRYTRTDGPYDLTEDANFC